MRAFRYVIEARVREAEQRGDFESLANKGKPLPVDPLDSLPEETRMDGYVMRSTGSIPEEVKLLKAIETWTRELEGCERELDAAELRTRIRDARLRLSILFENAGRRHLVAALARGEK
jgi:hypothetical protein